MLCGHAQALLRREPRTSLTPEALVHEAYLRLALRWQHGIHDQTHAVALTLRAMRQVLLDQARARSRAKRPQPGQVVTLDAVYAEQTLAAPPSTSDTADALALLARHNAAEAEAIQLTYLHGYTNAEVAKRQHVSHRTVKRRRRAALMILRNLLA
ncbi:MAG: hypothetical protein RhofKO_22740 [Rhodothermales bacterium]